MALQLFCMPLCAIIAARSAPGRLPKTCAALQGSSQPWGSGLHADYELKSLDLDEACGEPCLSAG